MATKVATRRKMAKEEVEEEEEEEPPSRMGLWAILSGTEQHQWEPLPSPLSESDQPDSHHSWKKYDFFIRNN